jgi:hypothetical protein
MTIKLIYRFYFHLVYFFKLKTKFIQNLSFQLQNELENCFVNLMVGWLFLRGFAVIFDELFCEFFMIILVDVPNLTS